MTAAEKQTLYSVRERVIQAIDRGEWKHSWHLPKNNNGDIDWFDSETAKKVREILEDEREWSCGVLARAHSLLDGIDWEREFEE